MPKNGRSFFERITGSVTLNDVNEFEVEEKVVSDNEVGDWLEDEVEEGELAVDVYQTPPAIII